MIISIHLIWQKISNSGIPILKSSFHSDKKTQKSNFLHDIAKFFKVDLTILIFIREQDHGRYFWVLDAFSQILEHFFQLNEPNRLFIWRQKELKQLTQLVLFVVCLHIFPFEKLNELVLLDLATTVGIDFVDEVFGLAFVHVDFASFEDLDDFVFTDTSRTVEIELHKDFEVVVIFAFLFAPFSLCH